MFALSAQIMEGGGGGSGLQVGGEGEGEGVQRVYVGGADRGG
jgi:hypothetical protein